jgi:hypothetical protein
VDANSQDAIASSTTSTKNGVLTPCFDGKAFSGYDIIRMATKCNTKQAGQKFRETMTKHWPELEIGAHKPAGGHRILDVPVVRTWAQVLHILNCVHFSTDVDNFLQDNWSILDKTLRSNDHANHEDIPRAAMKYVHALLPLQKQGGYLVLLNKGTDVTKFIQDLELHSSTHYVKDTKQERDGRVYTYLKCHHGGKPSFESREGRKDKKLQHRPRAAHSKHIRCPSYISYTTTTVTTASCDVHKPFLVKLQLRHEGHTPGSGHDVMHLRPHETVVDKVRERVHLAYNISKTTPPLTICLFLFPM